jgi:sigma54-dependent transcription regulator
MVNAPCCAIAKGSSNRSCRQEPSNASQASASRSPSEAGRTLFAVSPDLRKSTNDADPLRKYLARFDLAWPDIHPRAGGG